MNEIELQWVIGFIESAGSFTRNTIVVTRKDRKYIYTIPQFFLTSDPSVVEMIYRMLGIGRITMNGRRLEIRRKEELIKLANLLEGRMRTAKRKAEFEDWKRLLLQWKERGRREIKRTEGE